MIIDIDLRDINGAELQLGDTVTGYSRRYEEITVAPGIVEEIRTAPKPIADVPLFRGRICWDADIFLLVIEIDEVLAKWRTKPKSVALSHYSIEKVK